MYSIAYIFYFVNGYVHYYVRFSKGIFSDFMDQAALFHPVPWQQERPV